MTARITNTSYCLCGDGITVTSSSWEWVEGIRKAFVEQHSDEGHGRFFPTAAEAKKAARAVTACPTATSDP